MARQLRNTDLRVMAFHPVVLPPATESTPPPKPEAADDPAWVTTAEFCMGQVDAVLSLCRANKLNYRATVKQIETIVRQYGIKNK